MYRQKCRTESTYDARAVCRYYIIYALIWHIINFLIRGSTQYNNSNNDNNSNNLFVALLIADDWSPMGFCVGVSKR